MSRSLVLVLVLVLVAGCNSFHLIDMESRRLKSPYDAIDYFRYAVRLEEWDEVVEATSPRTQQYIDEHYGRGAGFKLAVGGIKVVELFPKAPTAVAEMTVWQLVHRSRILKVDTDDARPGGFRVQLVYDPEGKPLIDPKKTNVPLINAPRPGEARRFTVGIYEWIQEQNEP